MTNDENTYIGMSLPEGIRYITVFEKGEFENCGRMLRTFYRTEDRVKNCSPWETCSIWEAACHQTKTRQAAGL